MSTPPCRVAHTSLAILLFCFRLNAATNPPLPAMENTIRGISCVVFDLETTGLKAEEDRILEIGSVRISNGQVTERRSWLINPGVPIPPGSQRIHGITPEMVADAPGFPAAYTEFTNFVGRSILFSHNARFDCKFLVSEIRRHNLTPPDIVLLDTLRLFKRCFPKRRSYSLANLTADLCPILMAQAAATNDVPRERRFHSAGWDSECTAALLGRAMETLETDLPVPEFEKRCGGRLSLTMPTRPLLSPPPPRNGISPDAPAQ